MPITFTQLKQKAIAAGYNLKGEKFEVRDWPFIKAYLAFTFGIQANYLATVRDVVSHANSIFDPHFSFENRDDSKPVAGEYSYGTIHAHAGINLGTEEVVTIEGNGTIVEIVLDGKWTPVTSFTLNYTTQDIEIPFRFKPAQTGNSVTFSTPTFTSVYLFTAVPFESGDETPAICGEAVCGLTIIGKDE